MMKACALFLGLVAGGCSLELPAARPGGAAMPAMSEARSVRAAIGGRLAAQDRAIVARHADAFLITLAPDYVVVLRDGTMLRRPALDRAIRSDMALTRSVARSTARVDAFALNGPSEAVLLVTHEASRVLADAQGVEHRWENGVVHRETWILGPQGWVIARLEEQRQLYLRKDGRPL